MKCNVTSIIENLEHSRIKFKIRTKMLQKIPGNFKNLYKNVDNGIKWEFCVEDMTQNHCVLCPGRKEDRKGLDISMFYFFQNSSKHAHLLTPAVYTPNQSGVNVSEFFSGKSCLATLF